MKAADYEIDLIGGIAAVSTILDVICRSTGMGFAAVARVTEDRWLACSVLDHIKFGLKPGGELPLETTFCNIIRQTRQPVVIDHVARHETYSSHPIPRLYQFQSYLSVPIVLSGGQFFGTLCAIDPAPAELDNPKAIGMFTMFAELIALHIESTEQLALTEKALQTERDALQLRDQLLAMLSRDIKDPLTGIMIFTKLLEEQAQGPLNEIQQQMIAEISNSIETMLKVMASCLKEKY